MKGAGHGTPVEPRSDSSSDSESESSGSGSFRGSLCRGLFVLGWVSLGGDVVCGVWVPGWVECWVVLGVLSFGVDGLEVDVPGRPSGVGGELCGFGDVVVELRAPWIVAGVSGSEWFSGGFFGDSSGFRVSFVGGSSFFSERRNSDIDRRVKRFSSGPATLVLDGIFNLLTWLLLGGILRLRLRVGLGMRMRARLRSRLAQVEASRRPG